MVFLPSSSAASLVSCDTEIDQHFVVGGRPEALDARILQSGTVHVVTNLVEVRSVCANLT